jgi:hypothetical protein
MADSDISATNAPFCVPVREFFVDFNRSDQASGENGRFCK